MKKLLYILLPAFIFSPYGTQLFSQAEMPTAKSTTLDKKYLGAIDAEYIEAEKSKCMKYCKKDEDFLYIGVSHHFLPINMK